MGIDWTEKLLALVEARFGKTFANLVLLALCLVPFGLVIHFGWAWVVGPFFDWVSGFTTGQKLITAENALPILATFVFTLGIAITVSFIALLLRRMHRRVVPQALIDTLSDLRSQGIGIANERARCKTPADLTTWRDEWQAWRGNVVDVLNKPPFTKTEQLMFERLGLFQTQGPYVAPMSNQDATDQQNLTRELEILFFLIRTHQERH